MSRFRSAAWLALRCLPLLGVLALLPTLPALVRQPPAGIVGLPWRLEALSFVFLASVAVALAVVPLSHRRTLAALALAAVLTPALLLEHLLALPAALLLAALVLGSTRWLLASSPLCGALAWPYSTAGAGWNDAPVAAAFGTPIAALLLAAVAVVVAPVQRKHRDPLELALLPLWFVPLLRAIGLQPWRPQLGLLALVVGCGFAVWSAIAALREPEQRELAATAALAAALAGIGLLTTVGAAAALYGMLAYPLGLGLVLRAPRLAAPLPLSAGFVATWLIIGAVAASGAWLFAAALLLAALGLGVALVIPANPGMNARAEETKPLLRLPNPASAEALFPQPGVLTPGWVPCILTASWALGIGAPAVLQQLILPAVDQLQGGLTPFGLLAVWPWIGVAALDAGQRRVATLPTIAMALFGLVTLAGVWFVARGLSRRAASDPSLAPVSAPDSQFRSRVWWLGGRRGE